jgi:hypothetical protein
LSEEAEVSHKQTVSGVEEEKHKSSDNKTSQEPQSANKGLESNFNKEGSRSLPQATKQQQDSSRTSLPRAGIEELEGNNPSMRKSQRRIK